MMLSRCFLSFEILMQFPHAINNARVTTLLLLNKVVCWAICGAHCYRRRKESGKEEQKKSNGCVACFEHRRISLKMRAATRNIKRARLYLYPSHVSVVQCLMLKSHHSTQLLYCLWEGVFYLLSIQLQEKMKVNVIDENTF